MTDIIQEVEETLKQERLEATWRQYGSYLIAGAVIIVLITASISGWRGYNAKQNAHQTQMLVTALDQENKVKSLNDAAKELAPGHKAIALFTAAGILSSEGKSDAALAHYNSIAANVEMEPVYRDLASYMAVRVEWGQEKDGVDYNALLARLEPIWKDNANQWRWHARLQAAMIAAHGQQDFSTARNHLAQILDNPSRVPSSLYERARGVDHVFSLQMPQKEGSVMDQKGDTKG